MASWKQALVKDENSEISLIVLNGIFHTGEDTCTDVDQGGCEGTPPHNLPLKFELE